MPVQLTASPNYSGGAPTAIYCRPYTDYGFKKITLRSFGQLAHTFSLSLQFKILRAVIESFLMVLGYSVCIVSKET